MSYQSASISRHRLGGECDEELAALARMADALSMLGMDPWAGTRMAMGGLADAPQEEEQVDMDLSGN